MSNASQRGNAGVTILVIVVILIVAGILFFKNRADAPVMIDETATTTPATTTATVTTVSTDVSTDEVSTTTVDATSTAEVQ